MSTSRLETELIRFWKQITGLVPKVGERIYAAEIPDDAQFDQGSIAVYHVDEQDSLTSGTGPEGYLVAQVRLDFWDKQAGGARAAAEVYRKAVLGKRLDFDSEDAEFRIFAGEVLDRRDLDFDERFEVHGVAVDVRYRCREPVT